MRIFLLILLLIITTHAGQGAARLVGTWDAKGQPANLTFKMEQGKMQGYIISNPEDASMVGVHLFRDLVYDPQKNEWHGLVYDQGRNKLWKGTFRMPDNNTFLMMVKWKGIGRTDVWERIKG